MSFKSASLKDKISANGASQKGHSIADGYTFPFLFSGAEQLIFLQMKLTVYIFWIATNGLRAGDVACVAPAAGLWRLHAVISSLFFSRPTSFCI